MAKPKSPGSRKRASDNEDEDKDGGSTLPKRDRKDGDGIEDEQEKGEEAEGNEPDRLLFKS